MKSYLKGGKEMITLLVIFVLIVLALGLGVGVLLGLLGISGIVATILPLIIDIMVVVLIIKWLFFRKKKVKIIVVEEGYKEEIDAE